MIITPEIRFEEVTGPAKCWKCGDWLGEEDRVFIAQDMVGRPSFDKEQFVYHKPQFCQKCYEKINK